MAIFSVNRSFQTLVDLQSRALRISSCFRTRKSYKSSVPVRFIPKDNTIQKFQSTQRLEGSADKEANFIKSKVSSTPWCSQNVPNFEENKYGDNLFDPEIMDTNDTFEQAEEFQELKDVTGPAMGLESTNSMNEVIERKFREDAENTAITMLAARAFTAVELRKKLRGKKYPLGIVESVIAEIKCRGLLNDGLYAESFSQSRWLSSTWGPKRIKQALVRKGVSEEEASRATKLVFEDSNDDNGDCMTHGMSKPSMDRLFLQASKQWLRWREASPENRKSKIVRWLQYRGFSWGVTSLVLKKLESQHPP